MASNPATELASAIQSLSIKQHPSAEHDINPSTAAETKIPIDIVSPSEDVDQEGDSRSRSDSLSSASTIPSDVLISNAQAQARPRARIMPPLPDFRFEQSYLTSIKNANTNWEVAYITIRDQIVWPLVSGMAYNLIMFGWRHWNRSSKLSGRNLGARIRRWWWDVNNWKVPERAYQDSRIANEAEDFFVNKFGAAQGD